MRLKDTIACIYCGGTGYALLKNPDGSITKARCFGAGCAANRFGIPLRKFNSAQYREIKRKDE